MEAPVEDDSEPEMFDMEVDVATDDELISNDHKIDSEPQVQEPPKKQQIIYLIEDSSESDLGNVSDNNSVVSCSSGGGVNSVAVSRNDLRPNHSSTIKKSRPSATNSNARESVEIFANEQNGQVFRCVDIFEEHVENNQFQAETTTTSQFMISEEEESSSESSSDSDQDFLYKKSRKISNENECCSSPIYVSRSPRLGLFEYPARFKMTVLKYLEVQDISSVSAAFYVPEFKIELWMEAKEQIAKDMQHQSCTEWEIDLFIAFLQDDARQNVELKDWLENGRQLLKSIGKDDRIITVKWARQWCRMFGLILTDVMPQAQKETIPVTKVKKRKYFPSFKLQVAKFARTHTLKKTAEQFAIDPHNASNWSRILKKLKEMVQEENAKLGYLATLDRRNRRFADLENELYLQYKSLAERGEVMQRAAIISRAHKLAREYNVVGFSASSEWYKNWVQLYLNQIESNKAQKCQESPKRSARLQMKRARYSSNVAGRCTPDLELIDESVELANNTNVQATSITSSGESDSSSNVEDVSHDDDSSDEELTLQTNADFMGTVSSSNENRESTSFCKMASSASVPKETPLATTVEKSYAEARDGVFQNSVKNKDSGMDENFDEGSVVKEITYSQRKGGLYCQTVRKQVDKKIKRTRGKCYDEEFKSLVANYAYENGVGLAVKQYNIDGDLIKTWCWSRKYLPRKNCASVQQKDTEYCESWFSGKSSSVDSDFGRSNGISGNNTGNSNLNNAQWVIRLKPCYVRLKRESLDDLLKKAAKTAVQKKATEEFCPKVEPGNNNSSEVLIAGDGGNSTDTSWGYSEEDSRPGFKTNEVETSPLQTKTNTVKASSLQTKTNKVKASPLQTKKRKQTKSVENVSSSSNKATLPDGPTPKGKRGERYTSDFKLLVTDYAISSTYKEASRKFGVHHSTVAEWAKEHAKQKFSDDCQQPVDDSAGALFLQWLQETNESKRLVTPQEVLQEVDQIVSSKDIESDSGENWFYLWYKHKIERIRLSESDQIDSFAESLDNSIRISYPPALKLEIARYAERCNYKETARCFQINREAISKWTRTKTTLVQLCKEGRMRQVKKSQLDEKRAEAEGEAYDWYKVLSSQNIVPKFTEVQKHAHEVFQKHGILHKFSKGWYHKFCQRFHIMLRYTDDDEILEWILAKLEQNQTVTHQELLHHALEVIRWKKPEFVGSAGWVIRFCKRHWNLLQTFPSVAENLPMALEKKVAEFRDQISGLHNLHRFGTSSIGALDEIPLSFLSSRSDLNSSRGLLMRNCGLKNCQAVVFLACLMDGTLLPPLVLLKKDGPIRTSYDNLVMYQDEVSISIEIVCHWLSNVWFIHVPVPNLLLLDCFEPHSSSEVRNLMEEFNVTAPIIPSGCTSKLHPVAAGLRNKFEMLVKNMWQERRPSKHSAPTSQEILSLVNEACTRLECQTEYIRRSFIVTGVSSISDTKLVGNNHYLMNCPMVEGCII